MVRLKESDRRLLNLLDEVETEMNVLRNEYELYFLQQIRRAPEQQVAKMKRTIRRMIDMPSNNTQLKFKKNVLHSRWGSLQDYWRRINYQIEKGTYRRHIDLADHREKMRRQLQAQIERREREVAAAKGGEPDATAPAEMAAPPPQPPPRPKRDAARPLPAFEAGSPELLDAYVSARKETGESAQVDARKLALTLKRNAMAIKARTGCKRVVFRVAIEEGKTRFKAVPIK